MEHAFWIERWKNGEIGFHQPQGNDQLVKHWASVGAAPGSPVFVPLCGKTVDMMWLAARGHPVIGCELSPLAVTSFFSENGLPVHVSETGPFTVYAAGPISIWCGDFFELEPKVTAGAVVYDRAALVAMPPRMQPAYARKLQTLAPRTAMLLTALDYPEGEIAGPPFATPEDQVRQLFSAGHDVTVLESRDGLSASPALQSRGVTRLTETTYRLSPNA